MSLDEFLAVRPRLFGIAYRMLGTAAEAEEVVQEAWLRWSGTDRAAVRDPAAFLTAATTRLAINAVGSAYKRRETYIGPWLPGPVLTGGDDPYLGAERGEALQFAVMMLLEKLNPVERAAYVLREAFDYEYREIAEILETGEANARQLVSRAKKHVASERKVASPVAPDRQRKFLEAFIAAARNGEVEALERLFAGDVMSYSDGGGKSVVPAARIVVAGRERVAKFISSFAGHFWTDTAFTWLETNGQSSVLITRNRVPIAVAAIEASENGIEQILWMMNPEKLSQIEGVSGPA